jgi:hypothetical protein
MSEDYIEKIYRIVTGSFILAQRWIFERPDTFQHIKLSTINRICHMDKGQEGCVFYTYKDSAYWVPIGCYELRIVIDSFISNPIKHIEEYGKY